MIWEESQLTGSGTSVHATMPSRCQDKCSVLGTRVTNSEISDMPSLLTVGYGEWRNYSKSNRDWAPICERIGLLIRWIKDCDRKNLWSKNLG